jgi:hypothetical protein
MSEYVDLEQAIKDAVSELGPELAQKVVWDGIERRQAPRAVAIPVEFCSLCPAPATTFGNGTLLCDACNERYLRSLAKAG